MSRKLLYFLSFIFFLCITANVSNADLIAYWPFDEGAGEVATDVVGGAEAVMTDIDWVAGQSGGSAAESTRGGDEILVDPAPTPTTQDLSIAWWMVDTYDSWHTMMNKSETSSTAGYAILLRPTAEDSPLRFRIGGFQAYGGWGTECRVPGGAYNDGEWTHVVCTYDNAVDTASIYINGLLPEYAANNPKVGGIAGPTGYCEGLNDPAQPLYMVGQREAFGGTIDEVAIWDHALTAAEVLEVLAKGPKAMDPGQASRPTPADEAGDIPRDLTLSWTSGKTTVARDVFLGTSMDDVNDASVADPLGTTVGQDLNVTEWNPGRLEFGQTYYWRVDEANGSPDNTVFKGNIWSLSTEPYSYPIETVTATASSEQDNTMVPANTVNGSGLDELDQHGTSEKDMWLSAGEASPWIQFEFDMAYKVDQMWVWNSNQVIEVFMGLGAKDVTVEFSTDGEAWTALEGGAQFNQAPGNATYTHNTVVDLGGVLAKYVKLTINSSWGVMPNTGLSEVRFFYIPTFAREAVPADGAANVDPAALLTWRAGREAASHQVYLGTDPQALPLVATTDDSSYAATQLDYDTSYYWQVVEVNEAEDPTSYASAIWSFSTAPYGIVDDFEGYDDDCNRIFFGWTDGLGHNGGDDLEDCDVPPYNGNGTGSIVGNASSPFAEKTIFRSGRQSMPLSYEGMSETTLMLGGQDWTGNNIQSLSVHFHGAAGNTGQLYVKIDNTKLIYDGAPDALSTAAWLAWNIDLSTTGANLTNVGEITIGVENGSGMLYIDDIRLYPKLGELITPADPGTANLVGAWDLNEGSGSTVTDSSGNGYNGTIVDAAWDAGQDGSALLFNGTSAYVNIDGFKGITAVDGVQQAFTVSNWIKTEYGEGEMVTWGTNAAPERLTWRINADTLRTEHGGGNIRGNTVVSDNEWHHVALTVTEGASLRVPAIVIYLDGQADMILPATGSDTAYNLIPDLDVRIGMGGPTGGRFFTGLIDEVMIFDRALDASEIMWLAGKTSPIHKPF
jgi:hypothetical protein